MAETVSTIAGVLPMASITCQNVRALANLGVES